MSFRPREFLTAYNISFRDTGANTQEGWVNIMCPLCDDHNYHGGFNEYGGYYNCWRCGGSQPAWVISRLLSIGFYKAVQIVEDYSDDDDFDRNLRNLRTKRKAPKKQFSFPLGSQELQPNHKKYLSSRGFDPDFLEKKYGLLGTGILGSHSYRIVIPVFYNGLPVSWTARSIVSWAQPRYLSCPEEFEIIDSDFILYNLDNCQARNAIVVEGPTDVWRIGDGSFATLSTSKVGFNQVNVMASKFDFVTIVFDPEKEAQEKAKKLAYDLSMLGVESQVIVIDAEDPAKLVDNDVKKIRELARLDYGSR